MQRSFIFFLSSAVLLIMCLPFAIQAQPAHLSCEKAQHSADVMACLNREHDKAQAQLNDTFLQILKGREESGHDVATLREIQSGWLAYRDQECQRQSLETETESLKRIQELKCLTALTEQRTNILKLSFEQSGQAQKKIALPLWMNVAASEKPDVYWNYGGRLQADINCDGANEDIMMGIAPEHQDLDTVLVIAHTPVTGKPGVRFYDVRAMLAGEKDKECHDTITHNIIPYPVLENHEDEPVSSCVSALALRQKDCSQAVLYWDGEDYKVFQSLEK